MNAEQWSTSAKLPKPWPSVLHGTENFVYALLFHNNHLEKVLLLSHCAQGDQSVNSRVNPHS